MRKTELARLLARRPDGIFVAPFEQGEIGPELFEAACRMGLEGLVSKRRDRPSAQPTFHEQRVAHGAVSFRPSRPESGLDQVLLNSLPMSRSAVVGLHLLEYESPHIVKRPQKAGAPWSTGVNLDRFKNKLVHKRTPRSG